MGRSRTERIDLRQTALQNFARRSTSAVDDVVAAETRDDVVASPPMMTLAPLLPMIRWAVSLPVRLIDAVSAEEIAAGRPG